jgi:hypothetical protein
MKFAIVVPLNDSGVCFGLREYSHETKQIIGSIPGIFGSRKLAAAQAKRLGYTVEFNPY